MTGAVMFLIEDEAKAILYTGDIRCKKSLVTASIKAKANS